MPKVLGAILGLAGLVFAPGVVEAQPAVPPVLPWFPFPPEPVSGTMGSYSFNPNIIPVGPPAGFDARGIRAAATNDPSAAASAMPGSTPGLSPNKANALTASSSRYRIGAGSSPNPSLPTINPGMNIGAGMEAPVLEDPGGVAPKTPPSAESSQPTSAPAVPGQPAPVLEAASGTPAPATPSPTPTPASGPPPVEVPAASSPTS
ncbi:hypothetical protein [Mycobacterium sp. OTB74]|uniref:hypothetical protein n=1 Tax=Mycobacterium sp. OTB74 TaxID=1853452 RepID=UPI00247417DC|nr:hypothetical protein [Mycobacterium sp. OTB74]MDH6245090.1 hypothetical protein [Mycobacterium sp. OTB74]